MNKQKDRLTTDKTKIFVRENITLMSVTKDEVRRHYNEIFDRLQEYEVAEETGQIIVPPCKVGDMVFAILYAPISKKYYAAEKEVLNVKSINDFWYVDIHCGGKTSTFQIGEKVFLSKEEAEAKLKEGVQG